MITSAFFNQLLMNYITSHPGYNLRNITHKNHDKYETIDFCDEFYKYIEDAGVDKGDNMFTVWRDRFFSEMEGAL